MTRHIARTTALWVSALLMAGTVWGANPDNVAGSQTTPARFVPGQDYTLDVEVTYDTTPLSLGLGIEIFSDDGGTEVPADWAFASTTGNFPVAPAAGTTNQPYEFGYIQVPASPINVSFTFSVPQDFEDAVQIRTTVSGNSSLGTGGQPFSETLNVTTVDPPQPPDFTNPVPADQALMTAPENFPASNRVSADGQSSITFSVDISATQGQTLTGSVYYISPAVNQAATREPAYQWDADWADMENWVTYDPNTMEAEWPFSNTAGTKSFPEGHVVNWTPIAADQDGTRTFTWEVPQNLVTKATPLQDRVFVAGVLGEQDNGGERDFLWAVRVDPVNQVPVIDDASPAVGTVNLDEGDDFTFTVTASDPDPSDMLSIEWWFQESGEPSPEPVLDDQDNPVTGTEFSGTVPFDRVQHPNKSQTGTLIARVSDGTDETDRTWDVTFNDVNQAPNALNPSDIVIQPNTPKTTDELICTVADTAGDPDDVVESYTEPLLFRYTWTDAATRAVLRETGPTADMTDTLPSGQTLKNMVVTCSVSVLDNPYGDGTGALESAPTDSAQITILNTPPEAVPTSIFIRKMPAITRAISETVMLEGVDVDADEGVDELSFQIATPPQKGTVDLNSETGELTYTVKEEFRDTEFFGPNADTFAFTVADEVPLRAVSEPAIVTVTYRENLPPEIVTITPSVEGQPDDPAVDEGDTQSFSATFTDDNDPSGIGDMEVIEWYVDGELVQTKNATPTGERAPLQDTFDFVTDFDTISNDPATGHRDMQKDFTVRAVGRDNQGAEVDVVWTLTVNDVDREAPAPTVAITPENPATLDDLMAEVTDQQPDPDGDEIVGYTYMWSKVSRDDHLDNQTLAAEHTVKNDTWQVVVTPLTNPYDTEPGESANSGLAQTTIVNTPPTAVAMDVEVDEDNDLQITLQGDDPDVEDGVDSLTFALVASAMPDHGVLMNFDAGTGEVLYRPDENYNGPDAFQFTVNDGANPVRVESDPATVNITVNPVNDAPTVDDVLATTDSGEPVEITLTANDVDDGQTFTFQFHCDDGALQAPMHGTLDACDVTRASTGQTVVTYTPDPGYTGTDWFEFKAVDDGTPSEESQPGRVDLVIGTPLWYPFFSWEPAEGFEWYNVQIWDGVPESAGANVVLETNINGTDMSPLQYFRAGSEGLLPGEYTWRYRTWNPAQDVYGQVWRPVAGRQHAALTVEDYGFADMPTNLGVAGGPEPGDFELTFTAPNARGWEVNVTGPNNYQRTYRGVYRPDPQTGVIPLNQPTMVKVSVPGTGTYSWEVRGFNPLDERDPNAPAPSWAQGPDLQAGAVAGVVPGKPINLLPEDDAVIAAPQGRVEITLQWDPVFGADSYLVFLGPAAGNPILNYVNVGNTTTMRVDVRPGSFTWMVIAQNTQGQYGPWSDSQSLEIIRNATQAVIIKATVADAENNDTLTFVVPPKGNPPEEVNLYHLDVESGTWTPYLGQVTTVNDNEAAITVPGADFDQGEVVQVSGIVGGTPTDYKLLTIKLQTPGNAPDRR